MPWYPRIQVAIKQVLPALLPTQATNLALLAGALRFAGERSPPTEVACRRRAMGPRQLPQPRARPARRAVRFTSPVVTSSFLHSLSFCTSSAIRISFHCPVSTNLRSTSWSLLGWFCS
jgi:hypothetical protein